MRKKDDRVGDKYGYKKKDKKPKRERERKIKRDPQKGLCACARNKLLHYAQLARKYTLHVARTNFSHSHAY